MMSQQITTADEWIEEHYLFGSPEGDQSPTLEWFLNLAECAVICYGAKVVLLDPWNRLEACRAPGESETDYIGRCLRALHDFSQTMNCHVQVIAHPAKQLRSDRRFAPDLMTSAARLNAGPRLRYSSAGDL